MRVVEQWLDAFRIQHIGGVALSACSDELLKIAHMNMWRQAKNKAFLDVGPNRTKRDAIYIELMRRNYQWNVVYEHWEKNVP